MSVGSVESASVRNSVIKTVLKWDPSSLHSLIETRGHLTMISWQVHQFCWNQLSLRSIAFARKCELPFIMDAARPKIGALVQERLVVEDFDRQKRIISSIHDTSHMNWTTDMVLNITLKQSPYYMLFLQQMRLPIKAEILAQSSTTDDREDNSFEETVGFQGPGVPEGSGKHHQSIEAAEGDV